jgi:hypothetical protein
VHFLSDVVGGWALGTAWALLVAVAFAALPGGRGALPPREGVASGSMTGPVLPGGSEDGRTP